MDEEKDINKDTGDVRAEELEKRLAELTAALEAAKGKKILPEEKKRPLWKRICSGAVWTVLCLTFAFVLIITVAAAVGKSKGGRTEILGYSFFIVMSGSMEPEIKVDDVIITKRVAQDKIGLGDDIAFVQGSIVITHRVIEFTERGFITQGIAPGASTDNVQYQDVLGKVVFKSAALGALYKLVSSQYGFLFVIVVPLFLFVIYESWALSKKFRALKAADKEEKDD